MPCLCEYISNKIFTFHMLEVLEMQVGGFINASYGFWNVG